MPVSPLPRFRGTPRPFSYLDGSRNSGLETLKREAAGIPDVRLHDLRHSVASDAIMDGVPLEVVGKMLGHRNYQTTQRYAHIADSVLRDAFNQQ